VVELSNRDYDVDQIAYETGHARSTVCRYLKRAGTDRPRRRSQRQLSADERAEQADRARQDDRVSLTGRLATPNAAMATYDKRRERVAVKFSEIQRRFRPGAS
jgi:hypothetical protein